MKGKNNMRDLRYEKLANNLLTFSINIQPGEHILVEILGEEAIPLAKEIIKKMDLAGFMGENGIVFQNSGKEEEDFPENITGKQLFHEGLGAVSGNADDGGLALCEQADFPGAVSI